MVLIGLALLLVAALTALLGIEIVVSLAVVGLVYVVIGLLRRESL